MRSPESYNAKVKDYVKRFAKNADADNAGEKVDDDEDGESEEESDEMSDPGVSDDEAAGKMDP
jgi:ubiquitin-conjugating enzyme E2 H